MYYRDERVWHRPFRELLPALILVLLAVVGGIFALSFYLYGNYHVWENCTVGPTCTSPGYTTHTCRICSRAYTDSYTTAAHEYSEFRTVREPGEDTVGIRASYCKDCGDCHLTEIAPTLSLPRVYFEGDASAMSSDVAVPLKMTYDSYDTYFEATAVMKWQGFTAAGWAKKNYNIKLFTDGTLSVHQREDLGFGNWGAQWKYTMKANFIDISHGRNISVCRLWGAMVRTRVGSNPELIAAPNGGAIDGFPVRAYFNGVYYGIYTMNMPKDKWIFGIDPETHPYSAIITSQMHNSTNKFRATTNLYTTTDWDVEYCSTEEDLDWLNESFNTMIRFVRDTSGDRFIDEASTYIDIEACIDYAIMCYAMYGPDNWDKNMVLVTYDGVQWIPSIYDADCSFGLHWDGTRFYSYDQIDGCVPSYVSENGIPSTSNLLLSKVLYYFFDDFKTRYWELREGILSDESMIATFRAFEDSIPDSCYAEDRRIWSAAPLPDPIDTACGEHNNSRQIEYFIRRHMAGMDTAMRNVQRR